jgi:hypothetical protein
MFVPSVDKRSFKTDAVSLICEAADRLGIDVDPDGLLEDREDILREKRRN